LREPVRYNALNKCICHAEIGRNWFVRWKILASRELERILGNRSRMPDAIRYSVIVEDCNRQTDESVLSKNSDVVNSTSYKRRSKGVANCN
ncbi:MAG: hypothetical protein ACM3JB_09475, partial [Acidobacteriaceae bacterium]